MRPARASLVSSLCVAAVLSLSGTAAAQERVTGQEFAERLDRAIDLAVLGATAPSPTRMQQVRQALGLPVQVQLAEAALFLPPDPFLQRLSGGSAIDFRRARTHLEGSRDALEAALDRDPPTPEQVQDSLERAYRTVVQIQPSLLDRIRRGVAELIEWFMHRLANFVGGSSLVAWLVLIAILGVTLILLRRARLVPERVLPRAGGEGAREMEVDWRRRAQEALHAGDLREAIRALYLALITTLAGRGLLADAPALTAGECRAAVRRSRPSLYPLVRRATESYERVLYGGATPEERDIRSLLEAETGARSA